MDLSFLADPNNWWFPFGVPLKPLDKGTLKKRHPWQQNRSLFRGLSLALHAHGFDLPVPWSNLVMAPTLPVYPERVHDYYLPKGFDKGTCASLFWRVTFSMVLKPNRNHRSIFRGGAGLGGSLILRQSHLRQLLYRHLAKDSHDRRSSVFCVASLLRG